MSITRNRFNNQIQKLKEDLLQLLNSVKKEHEIALVAIENNESDLSKKIIEEDKEIRKIAESITTTAIWRIASQQPFASDLRTIIAYMNIIRDLERISNYAKNISKYNTRYRAETNLVKQLKNLMNKTFEMMDLIAQAIETEDISLAYKAASTAAIKDKEIDRAYIVAMDHVTEIIKNSKNTEEVINYIAGIQQLKYIERLGDHLVNICETIVYMVKGKFYDLSIPTDEQ